MISINVESALRRQGGTTDLFSDDSVSSASSSCRRAHFSPSSYQTQTQVKQTHVDSVIDYGEIDGTQSDMQAETRKGHREEMEHLAFDIIKTFRPGARFDYDGTVNLFAVSLFISLVRGNMDCWSVKRTFQR